jgi:hypothetical protein
MPENKKSTTIISAHDVPDWGTPTNSPVPNIPSSSSKNIPANSVPDFEDSKYNFGKHGDFQPETSSDSIGKTLAHSGADIIPLVMGTAGSLIGPEGTAAGAFTGTLASKSLHKYIDSDKTPTSIPTQLQQGGEAALQSYIGGRVSSLAGEAFPGPVQSRFASAIGNSIVGQAYSKTRKAASEGYDLLVNGRNPESSEGSGVQDFGTDVLKNLGMDFGTSLLLKGVMPKQAETKTTLEKTLGDQRFRLRLPGGTGPLPENSGSTPPESTQQLGAKAKTAITGNLAKSKAIEKNAYDNFEKHVSNNVVSFKKITGYETSSVVGADGKPIQIPKIEDVNIRGPIYTKNSTIAAADMKPQIEAFMQGPEFQILPEYQQTRFKQLNQSIDKLLTGTSVAQPNGQAIDIPVQEWQTAKEMKTIISQLIGGKTNKTFAEGGLVKLAKTLDEDIDESVKNWKGGSNASTDLDTANAASKLRKTVFGMEIQKKIYGKDAQSGKTDVRVPGDDSEVFKTAYQSPEKFQRLLTSLGPENEHYLKQDYFDNELIPKGFGNNFSKFEPRKIIEELENPNSTSRLAMSSDQRNGLIRIMRAAETSGSGNFGMKIDSNNTSFALGAGTKFITGVPGSGAVVRVATKTLLNKLQETPEISNYAQQLIKMPVGNSQLPLLQKKIMQGLRGMEVMVDTGDGKEQKGTILDSGRIQFLKN